MTRKVLISPGFGAGWSTWNHDYRDDFLFDPELIAAVERGDDLEAALQEFVQRLVAKHGPDANNAYLGGARRGLRVVEVDGPFMVDEYDGSESIITRDGEGWI